MKGKKEYIVLGLVITALALYLIFHEQGRTRYQLPEITVIKAADISRLELTRPAGVVTLTRDGDRWLIGPGDYPADTTRVENMLAHIEKPELTALVSESKSYSRYQLDEAEKIGVGAFKGDKVLRRLDVGKAAPSHRHTFVRIENDYRVYHARGNFRSDFERDIDDLRDKKVLRLQGDQVVRIELTGDGKRLVLRKEPPVEVQTGETAPEASAAAGQPAAAVWRTDSDRKLEPGAIDKLVRALVNLDCEGYLPAGQGPPAEGTPQLSIRLGPAGEDFIEIFPKTDQDYPGRSSQNPYSFRLAAFRAEQILKAAKALGVPEPKPEGTDAETKPEPEAGVPPQIGAQPEAATSKS